MTKTAGGKKYNVGIYDLGRGSSYPKISPYSPHIRYPEYSTGGTGSLSKEKNEVYEALRQLFYLLGYDKNNFDKQNWNPLGLLIKPGMTVVIKPNFVLSAHYRGKNLYSVITHPSVLRALSDYCLIAMKGRGKLVIADAPQHNCNFKELLDKTKLDRVVEFLKRNSSVEIRLLDLRDYWSVDRLHFPSNRRGLPGDPNGKVVINLNGESALYTHPNPQRFYGAVYDRAETVSHHSANKQIYEVSKTIMGADVVISVPKFKVHKKVGVTLNQKGLVGICTNKNYIVHYTLGTPSEGGDQFPEDALTRKERYVIRFERWMYDTFLSSRTLFGELIHRLIYGIGYLRIFAKLGFAIPERKRQLDAGNWYGNDSAWRMVVDLAKVIRFADAKGKLHKKPQRRLFSVIDGVIGGENLGPLEPDPKSAGILIAGENFLAVDLVATRLMGYDAFKIKQFTGLDHNYVFGPKGYREISIKSNNKRLEEVLHNKKNKYYNFMPHPGWVGYIEVDK